MNYLFSPIQFKTWHTGFDIKTPVICVLYVKIMIAPLKSLVTLACHKYEVSIRWVVNPPVPHTLYKHKTVMYMMFCYLYGTLSWVVNWWCCNKKSMIQIINIMLNIASHQQYQRFSLQLSTFWYFQLLCSCHGYRSASKNGVFAWRSSFSIQWSGSSSFKRLLPTHCLQKWGWVFQFLYNNFMVW